MLSYRHSYHAGNFADVLKHIVLVEILESLVKKDKAFEYIDTHAGAGLFDLHSEQAQKLTEHAAGIGKLRAADWPELAGYFAAIRADDDSKLQRFYPGSPLIAAHFMRAQDKAWLFELHPADFAQLQRNNQKKKNVRMSCEDGLQGLLPLLPPASRRALVLIDPSYEIKSDYETVFDTLGKAHKRFSTGIYALWYPVVDRARIERLERRFLHSSIKNIQRFELGVSADSKERGMNAAGIIVINPPWGLYEKMGAVLPKLMRVLGDGSSEAFFKCDQLVPE